MLQLKKSMSEQKEAAEKKELELQSEVSSRKNTVLELEKVLEAHQLKSRIERETLNDIHLQTVKVSTVGNTKSVPVIWRMIRTV